MINVKHLEKTIKTLVFRILVNSNLVNSLRVISSKITPYFPWNFKFLKEVTNFYSQFLKKGDICFDIGANFGDYTRYFLKLKAKVICVEPQKKCIEKLYERFGKNKNVIIIEKAVGRKSYLGEIQISEKSSSLSTMSNKWKEKSRYSRKLKWNTTQEVEVTTLDNLIDTYGTPSFCKIDVEGFEIEVLAGLTKKIPLLSFEFHIELFDDAKTCLNHLINLGYSKFNFAVYGGWSFCSIKWLYYEEIIELINKAEDNVFLTGDIYAKL